MTQLNAATVTTPTTTPKEMFEVHIPQLLKAKPELVADIKASYQFSLSGEGGGHWYVDLTGPEPRVGPGQIENPAVVVTMTGKDFLELSFSKLNPQLAFMTGRLRVKGDLGLALKLQHIIVQVEPET